MKYKNIENLEEFKQDYDNMTIKQIKEKYKLNHKTIWSYAKKLGINRKVGEKRLYKVRDNYFDKSNDCSNKYYILGLIYTDGNLPRNSNSFIISNIDFNLLEDIKNELEYTGRVLTEYHKKFDKYIYKLLITSPQIRKDLEGFGLIPNKTETLKFPNIPSEYLGDFCRGLWDGDGSASTPQTKQKAKKMLSSSFVCANEQFTKDLLNILPVKKKTIYKRQRKNILYKIEFRGFDSLRLKSFFYKDINCLCMKRKKDIFFSYTPRRSETIISNPTDEG